MRPAPADDGPATRAAGAVLWRNPASPEVALVHRPRYDDWSLPKGKLDRGENPLVAAVREVGEETGHRVALGRRLGQARYLVGQPSGSAAAGSAAGAGGAGLAGGAGSAAGAGERKVVDYWAAQPLGGEFEPNAEVDRLRWLPVPQARELLTYDFDRAVLDGFAALPVPTATVLLVRHGKAGEREHWHGDDDLRPLTAAGHRQATELAVLLALFGPSAVYCAPPVRCRQSVQPLADSLGVPVVALPRLSETGYWRDPAAGRECFLELAARAPASVVCSQGGVIPDLVCALAGGTALDEHGAPPSRKGSTWVLSMRGVRCVAADYYDPP